MKNHILAALLLGVLSLAAYSNSFQAEFAFDDYHQILKNSSIHSLGNIPRFFTDAGMGSYILRLKSFRPVTYASFAVNYAVSGYGVWSYHAFNLSVHFLTAFLVYLSVTAVLKRAGRENPGMAALCASLLFALHPIQTNAVTYVSGRAALLAALFYMLSFYSFLRFRAGEGKTYLWACAAPLFFFLGLLSKEVAVSLPFVMLAYDLVFTVRERGGPPRPMKRWLYYIPFAALLGVYLFLRKSLQGFTVLEKLDYGIAGYMMSEAKALLMYVRLMLLPVNQNADYATGITRSADFTVILSALLVAASLFVLYRLRGKEPAVAFFGLWFFIAIAPESSIVPIRDITVEYRMYLPSVGFIAVFVLVIGRLLDRPLLRKALAVSVIALFAVLTFNRNSVWATEYTLWSDVIKKAPYNSRAYINLGEALMGMKRYAEAEAELRKLLDMDLSPANRAIVANNIGVCLMRLNRFEESLAMFRHAAEADPSAIEPYTNLGDLYYKMSRFREAAEALHKAIELNPGFTPARLQLAKAYTALGLYRDALGEMEEAVKYSPKDPMMRLDLAIIYQNNGMYGEAAEQARAAIELSGDNVYLRREAESIILRMRGKM